MKVDHKAASGSFRKFARADRRIKGAAYNGPNWWGLLAALLILAASIVVLSLVGCSSDTATRVVTPTPPPEEAPDTGFFVEVYVTGNWSGNSMLNARCAVAWALQDELGVWGLRPPEWGCTAGTDEDVHLMRVTEDAPE